MVENRSVLQKIALLPIRFYRYVLSPFLGSNCRYYPSCSAYAQEAIEQHGVMHGLWLSIKRVSRCHPWHEGGIDPVPETTTKRSRN